MICRLRPEETWPLRQQVLHPSRQWPTRLDPLDLVPDSLHLGWQAAETLVGVGSIGRDVPIKGDPAVAYWRLRGMAVLECFRGRGIGGQLLLALLRHAVLPPASGPCLDAITTTWGSASPCDWFLDQNEARRISRLLGGGPPTGGPARLIRRAFLSRWPDTGSFGRAGPSSNSARR